MNLSWTVGNIRITQITEIEAGSIIQECIPEATPENIRQVSWLQPHFADEQGHLKAVVQSFVIDTGTERILVDTCNGNDKPRNDMPAWGNLQTSFLSQLEQAGYPPASITKVMCTHLHFDHVGWNTMQVNGRWVPTFPHAQYLFSEQEFAYWQSQPEKELDDDRKGFADSVLPIQATGLAVLVANNATIAPGITLFPTPGHTPHHVSVLIQSGEESALITGDAMHHPCQIAHPDWHTLADTNPDQATATRLNLLQTHCNRPTLILGSHFAPPTAGYIQQNGKSYLFKT